ncbi:MAG: hypothetical protein NXI32_11040 [bacterium]|nr:hypothetical protein [bacterium]
MQQPTVNGRAVLIDSDSSASESLSEVLALHNVNHLTCPDVVSALKVAQEDVACVIVNFKDLTAITANEESEWLSWLGTIPVILLNPYPVTLPDSGGFSLTPTAIFQYSVKPMLLLEAIQACVARTAG